MSNEPPNEASKFAPVPLGKVKETPKDGGSATGKVMMVHPHDSSLAKHAHRTALIADGEIVNEYVAKALPTLPQSQMLWATKHAKALSYKPGSMIISEGTNADAFYIVSQGTVEVVLPRENQSDVIAKQLGAGKFFGELAFFRDRKRHASVRAAESGPQVRRRCGCEGRGRCEG